MKNNILVICMALTLSAPAFAEETSANIPTQIRLTPLQDEEVINSAQNSYDENTVQEETKKTEEIQQKENTAVSPYRQPTNYKKIIKKFLLAMLAVVASSLAIFLGLTIYNKIRLIVSQKPQFKTKTGETELSKPDNTNSAVKTFLDKTKWD